MAVLLSDHSPIIALPCQSVSKSDLEIRSNCFSKLLLGFVKIGTRISLSCYRNLSMSLHGFVKIMTWICQILCASCQLLKFDQNVKAC